MRNRRRRWLAVPAAALVAAVLAGCTQDQLQGWMPSTPGLTNHVDRVVGLWTTSWIVLLVIGGLVWFLMLWAAFAYRRRTNRGGLPLQIRMPAQLRYNMPIEILFTVIPVILVLGFFAFTARDQAIIEQQIEDPDTTITVYGKRWAWDFVYERDGQESVYFESIQALNEPDSMKIDEETIPTLVLPSDSSIEIVLESRDVAHSFWVVEFLYKKDMLPGITNRMYFETGDVLGTFTGKCAELCGEYHSMMLFNVDIVEREEYEAYLDSLEEQGFIGEPGPELNPLQPDWGDEEQMQNRDPYTEQEN